MGKSKKKKKSDADLHHHTEILTSGQYENADFRTKQDLGNSDRLGKTGNNSETRPKEAEISKTLGADHCHQVDIESSSRPSCSSRVGAKQAAVNSKVSVSAAAAGIPSLIATSLDDGSLSVSKTLGEDDTDSDSGSDSVHSNPEKLRDETASKVFAEMPKRDPATKTPWLNLFANNRSPANGFKLTSCGKGDDDVVLDEEDIDVLASNWGHALIGYIAGKNPGKGAIIQCCNSWKVRFQIHFHDSGWIIIKFEKEEDRAKVLESGPYMIYGRPFMVKVMPELFNFNEEVISMVPIWVRLPNLPLELWNERALSKIATRIGTPIQSDKLTQTKQRLSFARVLVEVDVSKDLTDSVQVRMPHDRVLDQRIVFEFIPSFCSECKAIGHNQSNCARLKNAEMGQKADVVNPNVANRINTEHQPKKGNASGIQKGQEGRSDPKQDAVGESAAGKGPDGSVNILIPDERGGNAVKKRDSRGEKSVKDGGMKNQVGVSIPDAEEWIQTNRRRKGKGAAPPTHP